MESGRTERLGYIWQKISRLRPWKSGAKLFVHPTLPRAILVCTESFFKKGSVLALATAYWPVDSDVTEGVITTRSNRMKFRLVNVLWNLLKIVHDFFLKGLSYCCSKAISDRYPKATGRRQIKRLSRVWKCPKQLSRSASYAKQIDCQGLVNSIQIYWEGKITTCVKLFHISAPESESKIAKVQLLSC